MTGIPYARVIEKKNSDLNRIGMINTGFEHVWPYRETARAKDLFKHRWT